jgi:hypothetical protein
VAVGVGAGPDGGVAGRGLGVGVVVVAIGEPGAFLHEEIEAAALELGAVAVQVVAAELVDDHDDDQLGAANAGTNLHDWILAKAGLARGLQSDEKARGMRGIVTFKGRTLGYS